MSEKDNSRWRKRLKSWLCCLLVVAMLVPLLAPGVNALTINGEGNGVGGATSTASGSYAVHGIDGTVFGYRFTLVNSTGGTVGAAYDVYLASTVSNGWLGSSTKFARFTNKYSKMEYIQSPSLYKNLTSSDLTELSGTSDSRFYDTYTVKDTTWSLTGSYALPTTADGMTEWAKDTNSIAVVLNKAWGKTVSQLTSNSWDLAVEPIYLLKAGGVEFAMTVTEMAIYAVYDGTAYDKTTSNLWTEAVKSSSDANSWRFLSNYTHARWPMALHLSATKFGIAGGSSLPSLLNSSGGVDSSTRGTAQKIINGGYGLMLVFADTGGSTTPTSASYTVKHYQMNTSGTYPSTPTETQTLSGTAGSSVTPAVKSYTGFTKPSTQTVTVKADGTTVVNYYYARNQYTVTLYKGTGISAVTGAGTFLDNLRKPWHTDFDKKSGGITMIEQDTIKLLRECDAGVKMGIASIEDVYSHVQSEALVKKLDRCKEEHEKLQHQIQGLLGRYHDEGKNPNPMAKGMSWVKTNVQLGLDDSDSTVANLMTDGCNMGVKSLNRYLNQYKAADEESKDITKRLIHLEQQLTEDIRGYL